MKTLLLFVFTAFSTTINAQKPKDGTYTYSIAWTEWSGKSLGATCTVIVKGDSIKVIHNGRTNVAGKKETFMPKVLL